LAQGFRPGEIVPQSDTRPHAHDVTVIRGRRFPTCRHCKGVRFRFELAHAAKHVGEIERLEEARGPVQ
jgi:hypothetical protein